MLRSLVSCILPSFNDSRGSYTFPREIHTATICTSIFSNSDCFENHVLLVLQPLFSLQKFRILFRSSFMYSRIPCFAWPNNIHLFLISPRRILKHNGNAMENKPVESIARFCWSNIKSRLNIGSPQLNFRFSLQIWEDEPQMSSRMSSSREKSNILLACHSSCVAQHPGAHLRTLRAERVVGRVPEWVPAKYIALLLFIWDCCFRLRSQLRCRVYILFSSFGFQLWPIFSSWSCSRWKCCWKCTRSVSPPTQRRNSTDSTVLSSSGTFDTFL